MVQSADFRDLNDPANLHILNGSGFGRVLIQRQMRSRLMVQSHYQIPIVSNPKKFDIDGTPGMDGQSGSTKIWIKTVKGYDDVGARTT